MYITSIEAAPTINSNLTCYLSLHQWEAHIYWHFITWHWDGYKSKRVSRKRRFISGHRLLMKAVPFLRRNKLKIIRNKNKWVIYSPRWRLNLTQIYFDECLRACQSDIFSVKQFISKVCLTRQIRSWYDPGFLRGGGGTSWYQSVVWSISAKYSWKLFLKMGRGGASHRPLLNLCE